MDKKKENNSKPKTRMKLTREELLAGKIMPDSEAKKGLPTDDPLFRSPDALLQKALKTRPKKPSPEKGSAEKLVIQKSPTKEIVGGSKTEKPLPDKDSIIRKNDTKKPDRETDIPTPNILVNESQYLDQHLNNKYSKPRASKSPLQGASPLHKARSSEVPVKDPKSELLLKTIQDMKYRHEKELTRWKLYEQQVNNWKDRVLMIVGQLKRELLKSKSDLSELEALKEMLQRKDDEIKKLKSGHKKKKSS